MALGWRSVERTYGILSDCVHELYCPGYEPTPSGSLFSMISNTYMAVNLFHAFRGGQSWMHQTMPTRAATASRPGRSLDQPPNTATPNPTRFRPGAGGTEDLPEFFPCARFAEAHNLASCLVWNTVVTPQLSPPSLQGDNAGRKLMSEDEVTTLVVQLVESPFAKKATLPKDKVFGLYAVLRHLGVPVAAPSYGMSLAWLLQPSSAYGAT